MFEKNNDGVELIGLGKCTLDDVFNDPNGIGHVEEDGEYYYVFPNYKPGCCVDNIWMINKKSHQVSMTDPFDLFIHDVISKLKNVPLEKFKGRVS